MKYLHIIPLDSLLILPLAQMLHKYQDKDEHEFMVTVTYQSILKYQPKMLCIKGLKYIPNFKRGKKLQKMLFILGEAKRADYVVWHSFRTNGGYNPVLLFLNRKLRSKSIWIAADGEIGNYSNVPNRFLNRFIPFITQYVLKRLPYIGICFPPDREALVAQGVDSSKIVVLPYPIPPKRADLLHAAVKQECIPAQTNTFKLQLGMTSQAGNGHRLLVEKLARLEDSDQAVAFFPFKYFLSGARCIAGTKKYENAIQRKVRTLSGQSIVMKGSVPISIFLNYVDQLDAVFLANNTVCFLEFLFYLLARRKKIFLPSDSPLFSYLNTLGADIQPLERLDEVCTLQEALDCQNSRLPTILEDYFQEERLAKIWTDYFHSIRID